MEHLELLFIIFGVIMTTLGFLFIYTMVSMCSPENHELYKNVHKTHDIHDIHNTHSKYNIHDKYHYNNDTQYINNINKHQKPIYCLMVTGKDDDRYKFAQASIINFLLQTYQNKYLVILNHGDEEIYTRYNNRIKEIRVFKEGKTLGELRNMSLKYVPYGAIFTTWDDDDWRSNDYLETLYKILISTKSDVVMIRNRISYNLNNHSMWKETLNSGFVHFFMYIDPMVEYARLDTLEDQKVKDYVHKHKKVYIYDNDPKMYIRNIHKNNTSPYVNKKKAAVNEWLKGEYKEAELGLTDRRYAMNIYRQYYSF